MCDQDQVEDENHFLHYCPKYVQEREILYFDAQQKNGLFNDLDVKGKNIFLFTNMSRQIGKYIKRSYNKRYHIINN